MNVPNECTNENLQMVRRNNFFHSVQNNPFLCLLLGVIGGFLIGRANQYLVATQNLWCLTATSFSPNFFGSDRLLLGNGISREGLLPTATTSSSSRGETENLVLIGVMTARQYLQTRVLAAQRTWLRDVPGRVIFFSSEGSEKDAPEGVEVVGLAGVDDSYPPQKKSFLMLKYIHDNYRDKYRFFMRADDDVYVKTDKLGALLRSVDSRDRALFIGQAGLGNKNEFGMLYLREDENFCMGGPTMVLSRETLVRFAPHVATCLRNLYTTHEDVEIGRCISRYARVSCTWSYEMQKIFYNNYKEPQGSFTHTLKDPAIHRAITLHPFKNSSYLYRAHLYFLSQKAADARNRIVAASRRVRRADRVLQDRDEYYSPERYGLEPSLNKFLPRSGDEVIPWEFLSTHVYSAHHSNPRRNLETDIQNALGDIVMQLSEKINENAKRKGRMIDFKEIIYGYRRVVYPHSADYVLDMLLVYKGFRSKQKMTLPIRRHAYVQQPFLPTEGRIDPRFIPGVSDEFGDPSDLMSANSEADVEEGMDFSSEILTRRINFVLPLSGRQNTLFQFVQNFEEVCLKAGENVSLTVMLFKSEQDDESEEMVGYVRSLAEKYPGSPLVIELSEGPFSRGLALQKGANLLKNDDLLFFIDVDIHLGVEALTRIRLNTILGQQVYYPVVFSQYNPKHTCQGSKIQNGALFDTSVDDDGGKSDNLGNYRSADETDPKKEGAQSTAPVDTDRSRLENEYSDGKSRRFYRGDNNSREYSFKLANLCLLKARARGPFDLRRQVGYWREFGYGIAAMFKRDFDLAGGFDLDIKGWGKEDVDLVERFVKKGIRVFRSVDTGLVHIYHPITCNPDLDPAQYQMCLGSKASSYAGIDVLAATVLETPEIVNRNENLSFPNATAATATAVAAAGEAAAIAGVKAPT